MSTHEVVVGLLLPFTRQKYSEHISQIEYLMTECNLFLVSIKKAVL